MNFLIALLFIGVSLQTFYFYQIGSPLFSLISLLFLSIILLRNLKIKKNNSNYSFYFYILIILFSFFSTVYFSEAIIFTKIVGFAIVFFSCIIANNLYKSINIFYLIQIYLKIHIFFFYLQFLSFYIFQYHIDFLYPITGEEQRVFGGNFELPYLNSFMRSCGLFNEPGTYVTFIAPFVVLFGRWSKQFNRQSRIIYVLSLLSIFLSFSVFGFLFGTLILLFSSDFNKKFRLILGSILSFLIVVPYITYRFFIDSSYTSNIDSDSGLGFREVFLKESYRFLTSDIGALFFGSGHFSLDPKAKFIASFNDIGLIPYLIHFSGPIITFILLIILLKKTFYLDKYSNFGLLILFISKLSILAPFFPFLLTLLLWPNKNIDSHSSKLFNNQQFQ